MPGMGRSRDRIVDESLHTDLLKINHLGDDDKGKKGLGT